MVTYVVSVTKITDDGDEIQLAKELRVDMEKSTTSVRKIVAEALEKGELEDNPYAD